MHLKNGLRQIKPNCANFTHGRLLFSGVSTPPLWHIDAIRGASTPSFLCVDRNETIKRNQWRFPSRKSEKAEFAPEPRRLRLSTYFFNTGLCPTWVDSSDFCADGGDKGLSDVSQDFRADLDLLPRSTHALASVRHPRRPRADLAGAMPGATISRQHGDPSRRLRAVGRSHDDPEHAGDLAGAYGRDQHPRLAAPCMASRRSWR
jgi:hypothetical protein